MIRTVTALVAVWAAGFLIERLAAPGSASSPALSALPARLATWTLLAALWLGIVDRPWLAAMAACITLAVLTAISERKRQLVGEPLVFSDFGLLRLAVRHPDLYYTDVLTSWPALSGFAALAIGTGLWLWLEPPLLSGAAVIALLAGIGLIVWLGWRAARQRPAADWLRARVPDPDLPRHLARWGLLLTLVTYALRWRGDIGLPYPSPASLPVALAIAPVAPPDLVIVVQIESFMDPVRRLGEPALPGLAAARARARLHGTLHVPAHGAYTMRSEFAVLSGLSRRALGFRGFDPYLSTAARGATIAPSLASRLRARGFATLFMHPFRPGFFDRAEVVTKLGFEKGVWEADFAAAERVGPYIGDQAIAARILECDIEAPAFIMAVTMENHGPWPSGRLPGGLGARDQYLAHLANSDRAITRLIEGLANHPGRVLLCLYGDHPPILPELDAGAPPETDYVVLELGAGVPRAVPQHLALRADELGRLIMALSAPDA